MLTAILAAVAGALAGSIIAGRFVLRSGRNSRSEDRHGAVAAAAADLRSNAEDLNPERWMWGSSDDHEAKYSAMTARLDESSASLRRAAAECGPEMRSASSDAISATHGAANLLVQWLESMHKGNHNEPKVYDKAREAQRAAIESVDALQGLVDAKLGH